MLGDAGGPSSATIPSPLRSDAPAGVPQPSGLACDGAGLRCPSYRHEVLSSRRAPCQFLHRCPPTIR